jgi:hypothetical protein
VSAPATIFRVYVRGQLTAEDRIPDDVDEATGDRLVHELALYHGEMCEAAGQFGARWLVDIEFSDGEHVRFGTDATGMVWPELVARERLAEKLAERWAGR